MSLPLEGLPETLSLKQTPEMEVQVRIMPNPSPNVPHSTLLCVVAGQDYVATSNEQLVFSRGDIVMCHRITIMDDDICEVNPAESFFSYLTYVSGILPIDVSPPETEVIINGDNKRECGTLLLHFVHE